MDWDYPRPGWISYHEVMNGAYTDTVYEYQCIKCKQIESEQNLDGFFIEHKYLCCACVKNMFFERFDAYSIPYMDEVNGSLTYTSKGLGNRLPVPRKMRDKVFKRDKYTCRHCGCTDLVKLTVDHIHPYKHGGKDVFENFQTLCKSCNSKKGAKVGYVPKR